jgi:tetratricopeptide (TPR) repeat protein
MTQLLINTQFEPEFLSFLQENNAIYLETQYNVEINGIISEFINELGFECKDGYIVHIPSLTYDILNSGNITNIISYYLPFLNHKEVDQFAQVIGKLTTSEITRYIFNQIEFEYDSNCGLLKRIGQCKYVYIPLDSVDKDQVMQVVRLAIQCDSDTSTADYAIGIGYGINDGVSSLKEQGIVDEISDFGFDYQAHLMAQDIKEKVKELELKGNSEMLLNILPGLVLSKKFDRLSRVVINEEHRIFLASYNNIEVELTPLPKAVFLLFLNHPEGILLKCMIDHKEELLEIYKMITGRESLTEVKKSIDELVDPSKNSINEKCSRIKEAFLVHFTDSIAQHYFITGERGMPKSIKLNRGLVDWECMKPLQGIKAKTVEEHQLIEETILAEGKHAWSLIKEKNYLEALKKLTWVIEQNPFHYRAFTHRAIAHFYLGNNELAIEDNTRAIELNDKAIHPYYNRALALLILKELNAALLDANQYLDKSESENNSGYYLRGLILEAMGLIPEAINDWSKAKELGHPNAHDQINKYFPSQD